MSSNHHEEAILPTDMTPIAKTHLSCSACGGLQGSRARRKGLLERGPLSWLQFRPFRCRDCGTRFYSWRSHIQNSSPPARSQLFVSPGHDEFHAIIEQMKEAESALERASQS